MQIEDALIIEKLNSLCDKKDKEKLKVQSQRVGNEKLSILHLSAKYYRKLLCEHLINQFDFGKLLMSFYTIFYIKNEIISFNILFKNNFLYLQFI